MDHLQDRTSFFENTLLNLTAGSENSNTSVLEYCTSVLKIDKNVRNADGVTPLLMACRAGREEKILALLHLNVDVDLVYAGGETPLHWLGLLPDPTRVLEEFLLRGADINAQVTQERALPSFLGGLKSFYVKGPPLNWAMAMGNEIYVEALLKKGADINMLVLDKVTPVRFACLPGKSQFL